MLHPLKSLPRRKVVLTSLFMLAGLATMCQQQMLAAETIQAQEEPSIRDLLLPSVSNSFGAWSLTLQLLSRATDIIDPQGVTKELEKLLSDVSLGVPAAHLRSDRSSHPKPFRRPPPPWAYASWA